MLTTLGKLQHTIVSRNMGIGMGVAMMMQQAAQLSGASQYVKPQLDVVSLQNEMRRAKAEGRYPKLSGWLPKPTDFVVFFGK